MLRVIHHQFTEAFELRKMKSISFIVGRCSLRNSDTRAGHFESTPHGSWTPGVSSDDCCVALLEACQAPLTGSAPFAVHIHLFIYIRWFCLQPFLQFFLRLFLRVFLPLTSIINHDLYHPLSLRWIPRRAPSYGFHILKRFRRLITHGTALKMTLSSLSVVSAAVRETCKTRFSIILSCSWTTPVRPHIVFASSS